MLSGSSLPVGAPPLIQMKEIQGDRPWRHAQMGAT